MRKFIPFILFALFPGLMVAGEQPLNELYLKNFSMATISGSFTAVATSITLSSGHGSRMPSTPFRATIWNASDYWNAADAYWAGKAEILEVTSRATDVLTVVRGLEGTSGIASEGGKTYKIVAADTAAQIDNRNPRWINVKAYGAIGDGSTNDTTAITAAFTACPSGGTVFFPDGDYDFSTITISNTVNIILGDGTYGTLGNPLFAFGTIKNCSIKGKGKANTILSPKAEAGYAITQIGNSTNCNLHLEGFKVNGNSTADGGIHIQGVSNNYRFDSIYVTGFTKSGAAALKLEGCNQGLFIDCDFNGSNYGVYCEKYSNGNVNLHHFLRGGMSNNVTALYSHSVDGGNQNNIFEGVYFAANTGMPYINLLTSIAWVFRNCYFEGTATGTACISLGAAGDSSHQGDKNTFDGNYVAESGTVTHFIQINRGDGNRIINNHKVSSSSITNLVRVETNATKTYVAANFGNYPWTEVSGTGGAYDTFSVGHSTADFYKTTDGSDAYRYEKDLQINDGKKLTWSDVNLYRSAANVLKTDDDFTIADGKKLLWSDVNLYRDSANELKTDDDLTALGGYRQSIDGWYQDDVTASQSDVLLSRLSGACVNAIILPRAGSITGVCVYSNEARTAGTLTVTVFKNGTTVGLTAVLDGTNTTFKATTQAKDTDTFSAGDRIDIRITTDGSWTPTTADIRATVEVET